jgi:hypothetical protein
MNTSDKENYSQKPYDHVLSHIGGVE